MPFLRVADPLHGSRVVPLCGPPGMTVFWERLSPKNLPRIHPVLWVQRLLDEAHQADRLAVLALEEGDLAEADAVLAGAGAAHRKRAVDQPVVECLGPLQLLRIIGIDDDGGVEIAIAHVTQ